MNTFKIFAKKEDNGTISMFSYDKEAEKYGENRFVIHNFTKCEILEMCKELKELIKD